MLGLDAGYVAMLAGAVSFGWLMYLWCGRRDHGINLADGNTDLVCPADGNTLVVNSTMDTSTRPPSPHLSPVPLAPHFNEVIMERTIIRTRRVWLELRNPAATSAGAGANVYSAGAGAEE